MTIEPTRLRLLQVEDLDDDAVLVRRELERAGYALQWRRVETESDFVTALREQEWDLVLSDFAMPTYDGLRAFALLRDSGIDVPFIFVSGALGEERAVQAMLAGARDYILKGNLGRLNAAVARELSAAASRRARRAAEAAAEREHRRLALALEASGAGVFEHRVPPGTDVYLSERIAEIVGTPELPGNVGFIDWAIGRARTEDAEPLRAMYAALLGGRRDGLEIELRMQRGDGRAIDVAFFVKATTRDARGRAQHVVGAVLDISERRQLEAQFRQAQKLDAIGRLAGGVAHDFNNLLTVISGFGSYVRDALPEGAQARHDMVEVLGAAERAAALTRQLLMFSRKQLIAPRVLGLNAAIGGIQAMLWRLVGAQIECAATLAADLWNVRMDVGGFEQLLVNLVVNARDAMPDGGTLRVETANATLYAGQAMAIGAGVPAGEYVVLSVSDSGIGMDPDTLARIFEPFFTTKEAGRGTGLGLATCHGIVKQAGGHFWVASEPGRGTTFRVYLARCDDDVEMPTSSAENSLSRGAEVVLVVEDDLAVRSLIARVLRGRGYHVIEAPAAQEALRVCSDAAQSIDLLLTDVIMPGMSGQALVTHARELRPALRVLYVSGYAKDAAGQGDAGNDADVHIGKPFTPEQIANRVREVLDRN